MCYSRGAHDLGGALRCPSAGAWRCFVQVRATFLEWQPSQIAAVHRLGAGGAGFHQVSECWGLTALCTGAVHFLEWQSSGSEFGCGWDSVALGLALGRLALGRLALGRLALGLALAAQLLQPMASLCGLSDWGAEAGRW